MCRLRFFFLWNLILSPHRKARNNRHNEYPTKPIYMNEALTKASEWIDFYFVRRKYLYEIKRQQQQQISFRLFFFCVHLSASEFGVFNYFLILVAGIILNAVYMETCGIGFVLPVSQCDLQLTADQKGILGAATFLGIICSSHVWGYLADTKGRRCIIQPTLLIAFILSVLSTLTNNFYMMASMRFLNGFL